MNVEQNLGVGMDILSPPPDFGHQVGHAIDDGHSMLLRRLTTTPIPPVRPR
jgi:hypothetical protein